LVAREGTVTATDEIGRDEIECAFEELALGISCLATHRVDRGGDLLCL
jgi:hypothetical protein